MTWTINRRNVRPRFAIVGYDPSFDRAPPSGTLALTLDDATLVATGQTAPGNFGSLAQTLQSATMSAAGTVVSGNRGTLAAALASASVIAIGAVTVRGSLASTLDDATLSGGGGVTVRGSVAASLDPATVVSAGGVAVRGSLASTLDVATVAAAGTGQVTRTGSLSVTLDAATLSAAGTVVAAGYSPYVGPVANNTMLPTGTVNLSAGGEQSLIHPVRMGVTGATCSDVRPVLARAIGYSGLLPASYTVQAMWARVNGGAWSYQVTSGGATSWTVTSWAGTGLAGDLPFLECDPIPGLTVTHGDDLEIFAYVTGTAVPFWTGTNLEAMYTDEGFLETSGTTTPRRVTNPTDSLRRRRMQIITAIVGTTTAETYGHVGDSIGSASSGNLGDGSFAGHVRGVVASTLGQKYGVVNLSIGGEDPGQGTFFPELRRAYLSYVKSAVWGQGINSVFNKTKTAAESLSAMKRAMPLFNGKRLLLQYMSPITTDSTGNTAKSYSRGIGTTWTPDYNTLVAAAFPSTPVLPYHTLTRRDAANPTLWISGGTADGVHGTKNLQETIHDTASRTAWLAVADGSVPIAAFSQQELTHAVQSGTATYPTQSGDGGRRYLSTSSGTYLFNLPGLIPGLPLTLDFWLIVPSFAGAAIDICPSTTGLFLKRINVTAAGKLAVTEGAGATPNTLTSTASVTDGLPHHVRIVWDGTGSGTGLSIQIDGGTADNMTLQSGQTASVLSFQVKATALALIRDLAVYRRRGGDAVSTFTPKTTLAGTETDLIAFCSMNNTNAITLGPVLPQ